MLSIIKKLFNKPVEPAPSSSAPALTTAPPVTQKVAPPAAPAPPPSGDAIFITLKTVVATMPDAIKKRLDKALSGSEKIYISRADALRQLPTGTVKISFRDVVRMAPNMFLTPDEEMLNTQIVLPLQEILPSIKTLPRRSEQKQIAVPTDMEGVFGQNLTPSAKAEVQAPAGAQVVPLPPTPAAPVAVPKPPRPPVPQVEEKYVPPPSKTLEPQAPISFKPPETPPSKPAPTAPAPAPVAGRVAAPSPPGSPIPPTPRPIPLPTQPAAPAPIPMRPIPMSPSAAAPAAPRVGPVTPISPAPVAAAIPAGPVVSLGEVFGKPDKGEWSPQEVVDKAVTLAGVAGAIITTSDGLPVAFKLPEHLNGNVIGAFVPQMYTRITQYTRDLKLGDARNLTIIVDNVPLQLFKSGGIYFTALGKAGEELPKTQLAGIAAALGRQS